MTVTAIDSRAAEAVPPHDLATEQAVLGSMMLAPGALDHCLGALTPRAFLRPGAPDRL